MELMIGRWNQGTRHITLKNRDGTSAGTISISSPKRKRTKPIRYNLKEISVLIMRANTSANARMVVSRAHSKVALLRQKLNSCEYDSEELKNALEHALKMEKIAKKRMKHLQQEEEIEQKGSGRYADTDEMEEETEYDEEVLSEDDLKINEEKLRQLMEEYEKLMQESMKETEDLMDDMTQTVPEEMSSDDLELLKKKHRAKEMKEILLADLEYLKAMFQRLQREKESAGGNRVSDSGGGNGVSLELGGMNMPVQAMEAAAPEQGGSVDIII